MCYHTHIGSQPLVDVPVLFFFWLLFHCSSIGLYRINFFKRSDCFARPYRPIEWDFLETAKLRSNFVWWIFCWCFLCCLHWYRCCCWWLFLCLPSWPLQRQKRMHERSCTSIACTIESLSQWSLRLCGERVGYKRFIAIYCFYFEAARFCSLAILLWTLCIFMYILHWPLPSHHSRRCWTKPTAITSHTNVKLDRHKNRQRASEKQKRKH